jgi:hypothetical protein
VLFTLDKRATGATVPFGQQDNGGKFGRPSYMMQGLLCVGSFLRWFKRNEAEFANSYQ